MANTLPEVTWSQESVCCCFSKNILPLSATHVKATCVACLMSTKNVVLPAEPQQSSSPSLSQYSTRPTWPVFVVTYNSKEVSMVGGHGGRGPHPDEATLHCPPSCQMNWEDWKWMTRNIIVVYMLLAAAVRHPLLRWSPGWYQLNNYQLINR